MTTITDGYGQVTEHVYIGLGSNLGDSRRLLLRAWELLGQHQEIELVVLSAPYLSSPVGMSSSHWFVNAVGRVRARCDPQQLLEIMQRTEAELGRIRGQEQNGYQDRTIDLDLLYFGNTVYDGPRLTVPHPQRADRLFVLAPLATLAPDFVDPELGGTMTVAHMHERLLHRIRTNQVSGQELVESMWFADA